MGDPNKPLVPDYQQRELKTFSPEQFDTAWRYVRRFFFGVGLTLVAGTFGFQIAERDQVAVFMLISTGCVLIALTMPWPRR